MWSYFWEEHDSQRTSLNFFSLVTNINVHIWLWTKRVIKNNWYEFLWNNISGYLTTLPLTIFIRFKAISAETKRSVLELEQEVLGIERPVGDPRARLLHQLPDASQRSLYHVPIPTCAQLQSHSFFSSFIFPFYFYSSFRILKTIFLKTKIK